MISPTAVIAEDEPLLRAELREALSKLWPELVIRAEASDGFEALQALQQHSPQVMFLDIQMPGLSGLEVAQQAAGGPSEHSSAEIRHSLRRISTGRVFMAAFGRLFEDHSAWPMRRKRYAVRSIPASPWRGSPPCTRRASIRRCPVPSR